MLQTFADSDYAADDTKRSTMGIAPMMNREEECTNVAFREEAHTCFFPPTHT